MIRKLLLAAILGISLFLRIYRLPEFLGFWYDQGRDALVVSDFLHHGRLFLIGPTTGIEGIFLGPFYYYFLAPFYWLGQGNPVAPAVGIAVFAVLGICFIYKIGRDFFTPAVGLVGALLYGFSYLFIISNRWLSNPAPLPFFALICLWSLLKIVHHRASAIHWVLLGLGLGLSLQLEAASGIFFLPAVLISLILFRRSASPARIHLALLAGSFLVTLLPQLLFNFRHQNLLLKSFYNFLVSEKSFQATITNFYADRLSFYAKIFPEKFFPSPQGRPLLVAVVIAFLCLLNRRFFSRTNIILLIWWLTPVLVLLFYHGNHGYVWDYYFTGVFPAVALLLAGLLVSAYVNWRWARGVVVLLVTAFLLQNLSEFVQTFVQSPPGYISLAAINNAVDWVYQDSRSAPFNVDVYVPPVISYAYDYVFLWRGNAIYHSLPLSGRTHRLYTILEPDPGHVRLRDAWLARQAGIATVEAEVNLGPILVQRRLRI